MSGLVIFLFCAAIICSAVSQRIVGAGPYSPYYRPYGTARSYFYSGAVPPVAPYAPLSSVPPAAPVVPGAGLGDYYAYAASAAALGYPNYPYNYNYPYSYPYYGSYSGYPLLKK